MKTTKERFFDKVRKSPGCWEWTASRVSGYGQFWMDGKMVYANRASWIIHNGPIKNGLKVLHDCDNKPCVRPDHLHLGTDLQNDIEATERGLKKKKLDADKVRAIRSFKGLYTSNELADIYGVCYSTICEIWRGRTWGHLRD